MAKIISFLLSVIFTLDMFFIGLFPEKQLVIIGTDTETEYYINGESEKLRFGVIGEGNLFEPNDEIKVVVECLDEALDGTKAKISVTSEGTGFNKRGYVKLNFDVPYNTFAFSSEKNGIFTVAIELPDRTKHSFNIGVLPRNEQASDNFYYGIQPYINRAYTWGEGFQLPNYTAAESVDKILDAAQYLGVNLVREDSVGWGAMQSEPYGEVNFTVQDYLVGKVNERGMKYNWILGFNAGKWSAADKYKENYDESIGWTCPPDENIWSDFSSKVAAHYADNTDILWEIWNEPNWYFFVGTPEEYFSLLENTASIIKSENPSAYVYSGGLAVAEKESNLAFYQKSAELMRKNLLDNFGYHNHDGLGNYYDYMSKTLTLAKSAGLWGGGINSESGVGGADAATIACKALYTRSTGASGFVSFSFRKTVTPENDINDFAFFNEYLQPTEAAITYATVIRFLGNADFVKNVSNEKNLVIDEYKANGNKIEVYYSLGDKTKIAAPEGDYTAYDMYGNEISIDRNLPISNTPIYVVY
ncbi:MAG: hypothetical protein IKL10_08965 [Clostridia bacterium]|nr:hypothetical protein [Clostridia bacterium]